MKTVYIGMSADLLHPGHLNIIEEARKLLASVGGGKLIVGLLTDKAIASYKRLPYMSWEQRRIVVENVRGVSEVIAQETLDYVPNLLKIKPDYVLHGDDWKTGIQAKTRQRIVDVMAQWGGQVIDIPYTAGISSTQLNKVLKEVGTTPEIRCARLKRLLDAKEIVTICEAYNGLSGSVVENSSTNEGGKKIEFDGISFSTENQRIWRGKVVPNAADSLGALNDILDITTKPVIFDFENSGSTENFVFTVRQLERLGVSAVVIDDSGLDLIEKIQSGKQAQVADDFMIFCRIKLDDPADSCRRAQSILAAGADGVVVVPGRSTPEKFSEFAALYSGISTKPLVANINVSDAVTEAEMIKHKVSVVIYSDLFLQTAYPAMLGAAEMVLKDHSVLKISKSDLR